MAKIAISCLGSAGDVNPFLGIAIGLVRRGHHVSFITNPYFEEAVRAAGLTFSPIGTKAEFIENMNNPAVWDEFRAADLAFGIAAKWTAEGFRRVAALKDEGLDIIVGAFQCFGARIANEVLDIPMATVLHYPILAESVHDPVRYPILRPLAHTGPLGVRLMYKLADWRAERVVLSDINACRAPFGLAPVRNIDKWVWSPQRVIGLWPDWLRGPQKDWHPQFKVTGFITYDGDGGAARSDADAWRDEAFLARKPLVFTAGTAMAHSRKFFRAALDAVERLGEPALFLTQFREQLPERLPDYVRHLTFAPFGELLPHCSAIFHHGGVGTCARALRAGIPQVIVPFAFDQFDNAHLLARAGVATSVSSRGMSGPSFAHALTRLRKAPELHDRCRDLARKMAAKDPLDETCDLIEDLATGSSRRSSAAGGQSAL